MTGTINCVYETPCGWCYKWDKKCDKQILERGQRVKINPVDDLMNEDLKEILANKMCESELDHEWECIGLSTIGTDYICKKCYVHKIIPIEYQPLSVTLGG